MAHIYLEYTENLKQNLSIEKLMTNIHNKVLEDYSNTLNPAGLRTRAIEVENYLIADNSADYSFIHVTMKIGRGKAEGEKEQIKNTIFSVLTRELEECFSDRYIAVSVELHEFQMETLKKSNIRMKR